MSEKEIRRIVKSVCAELDERAIRAARTTARSFALPAIVGITLSVVGCDKSTDNGPISLYSVVVAEAGHQNDSRSGHGGTDNTVASGGMSDTAGKNGSSKTAGSGGDGGTGGHSGVNGGGMGGVGQSGTSGGAEAGGQSGATGGAGQATGSGGAGGSFGSKSCWTSADCAPDEACEGARACPQGAMCILPSSPGVCTQTTKCSTDQECKQGETCEQVIFPIIAPVGGMSGSKLGECVSASRTERPDTEDGSWWREVEAALRYV
jgi:hypothetical protein